MLAENQAYVSVWLIVNMSFVKGFFLNMYSTE